jgi:hypothetical protein
MPQLQNLVLQDRAATPVNHTFVPEDIKSGLGTVVESAGVPIGNNRVSVAMNKTTTGRYKGILKFQFPIVATETVNGVSNPAVVRTSYVNIDFTFDPSSSEQERKDVVGMVQSALDSSKTLVNDTIVKLQGVF